MLFLQKLNFFVRFLVVLLVAFLIVGCSGSSNQGIGGGNFQPTASSKTAPEKIDGNAAANAQKIFAANSNGGGAGNEDYRIAALDVLQIAVLGVKDLNNTVQVSTRGMISLPLINTVKAGGLTTTELEQDIARKLSANYLQSPQVTVFVKEYNSQRVTVDGAVVKPGIFPIVGKMSLLQSIALAEGLNRVADPTGVIIFRQTNGQKQAARFDLKMVRAGKIADPLLVAGDIVMVDESTTRTTLRDINDYLPFSGIFKLL